MQKQAEQLPGEAQCTAEYERHLRQEERSANTVAKYMRDIGAFFVFLCGREINKEEVLAWKGTLGRYAPSSVNSMLAAVNGYLSWTGRGAYRAKPVKMQRAIFAKPERELTKEEYGRLVKAAEAKRHRRLSLVMQTVCATGIRVSELRHITAEAVKQGRCTVTCKGKSRVVFLPWELCGVLKKYCREQRIEGGVVFRTKSGAALDRSNIWREMKALCQAARVSPQKVFPHNLRHLFARTYYRLEKDLSRLADLLGHASVTTTRIYTMESGKQHARQLGRMGLVLAQT